MRRTDLNFTSSVGFADTFPSRGRHGAAQNFCTNIAQFPVVRIARVLVGTDFNS